MELGYPGATGTVVTFSDGATSFYDTHGSMVVGGGFYDHIRDANARFIETANRLFEFLEPCEVCPIPQAGNAVFYVRTDAGIFGQGAAIKDLSDGSHSLSPLYRAGFEVFEQLRELARTQKRDELRKYIAALDEEISRKPNEVALYFERAEFYIELEELEKAMADYDKAISLTPVSDLFNARGGLHMQMGNLEAGLADFERAIQANPADPMGYSNRGAAHSKLGDVDAAIADYGLAIQHDPSYPNSYANRAYAYYKAGQYEKGIADCNQALALRPNHANTFVNRGHCRAALGDKEGASADFYKALELADTRSVMEEAGEGLRALNA
jgi:tetratricopeptide (TPR) repeat protein